MNIISNNCTAGFIYKNLLNTVFENPFIWCRIFNEDFLYLIENYNKINFNDFKLQRYTENLVNKTNPFYIKVENKIDIHYSHYYFEHSANKPLIVKKGAGADFYYNKIWETVVNNYLKRLQRMKGKPIFIFNDDKQYQPITHRKWNDILPQLITLSQTIDNKLIIITNNRTPVQTNNLLVINSKNIYPPYNLENNEDKILKFMQD